MASPRGSVTLGMDGGKKNTLEHLNTYFCLHLYTFPLLCFVLSNVFLVLCELTTHGRERVVYF